MRDYGELFEASKNVSIPVVFINKQTYGVIMFIRFLFFSLVLVSSANYAMESKKIEAREALQAVLDNKASNEDLVEAALRFAQTAGFRSDEYKEGVSRNGKKGRCKILTNRDKQKGHAIVPKPEANDENDCV